MLKSKDTGGLGIAVDIGTTNIKMCTVSCVGKRILGQCRLKNSQTEYSKDVMGRIAYACSGEDDRLTSLVREDIAGGLRQLGAEKAERVAIVGNGVMTALFWGDSLEGMKEHPFRLSHMEFPVREDVITAPAAAPFIGGDVVAGLSVLPESGELFLFLDLGTNGEMILGTREHMLGTSVAAGPAFECYNENGSTGVELLAEAYREGILDETGLLSDAWFESGYHGLTQDMIRDLQTAKAAVRTGVDFLLGQYEKKYGTDVLCAVKHVYLAGGMGVLSEEACLTLGMLPKEFAGKVQFLGNTALQGAVRLLTDEAAYEEMLFLSKHIISYPLAAWSEFNERYIANINFPLKEER